MDRDTFLTHLNTDGLIKTIYIYCISCNKPSNLSMILAQLCVQSGEILSAIKADLFEKYEITVLQDKNGATIKYF